MGPISPPENLALIVMFPNIVLELNLSNFNRNCLVSGFQDILGEEVKLKKVLSTPLVEEKGLTAYELQSVHVILNSLLTLLFSIYLQAAPLKESLYRGIRS